MTSMPVSRAACIAGPTSISTTASWKLAARSSRDSAAGPASARSSVAIAVFTPLKLKSSGAPRTWGARNPHALVVPTPRQLVDYPPTRIAQAHQLGHLVERLAGRVVAGAAQSAVPAEAFDPKNWVCPPDTSSAINGNAARCSSSGESRWPSR